MELDIQAHCAASRCLIVNRGPRRMGTNPLGGVWAFAALPVQGAAVVGVHGLSLLTLLLAGLPVLPDRRRAWLAGGAAALALAAFGAWRLSGPEPPGPPVRLVLVQAGVAQEGKRLSSTAL